MSREMMAGVLTLITGYLIGAVPFGYILYRMRGGRDIRRVGSGNIGATNVMRSGGFVLGAATLLLDAAKGAGAVALARWMTADPRWEAAAALVALVGHCFPVYLRFRGGKGIATGCGAYGLVAPIPMGLSLLVFAGVLLGTRMVSAASIAASLALPLFVLWRQPEAALLISTALAALVAIARHRDNIRRLLSGNESKVRLER